MRLSSGLPTVPSSCLERDASRIWCVRTASGRGVVVEKKDVVVSYGGGPAPQREPQARRVWVDSAMSCPRGVPD